MLIKRKHFIFRTGYDIRADCHHGFTLKIGKLLIACQFDWPHIIWFNRDWAVNEAGYIQGMPVLRRKPKRWLLRGVSWKHHFEVDWV